MRFGLCLVLNGGERRACWKDAAFLVVNKKATLASLAVMSVRICFSIFLSYPIQN